MIKRKRSPGTMQWDSLDTRYKEWETGVRRREVLARGKVCLALVSYHSHSLDIVGPT